MTSPRPAPLASLAPILGPWPTANSAVSGDACPPPAPPPSPERAFYDIVEVAARCGRSRGWVHKQIARGELRARRDGRAFVVLPGDLDAFVNGLEEV